MEVFIDNRQVDIDENTSISLTLAIADIENPERTEAGYSKTISIPMTPRNREVMGFTEQVHSREQFNNTIHNGEVRDNGLTIISGTVQLQKYVNNNSGGGSYQLNIIGASYEWIQRSQDLLRNLESDFTVLYNPGEVYANSISPNMDNLIRFLPVDRGAFFNKNAQGELVPRTSLVLKDYHPFLNVWKVIELIFLGYTIRAAGMEDHYKRMYFNGALYEPEDISAIREDNDFLAGTSILPTPNQLIFRGPFVPFSLFNSWDPVLNPAFFDNGVLSISPGGSIMFTPTTDVTVAMDCTMNYSCRIGPQGQFLDTIKMFPGTDQEHIIKVTTGDAVGVDEDFPTTRGWRGLLKFSIDNPENYRGGFGVEYSLEGESGKRYRERLFGPLTPGGDFIIFSAFANTVAFSSYDFILYKNLPMPGEWERDNVVYLKNIDSSTYTAKAIEGFNRLNDRLVFEKGFTTAAVTIGKGEGLILSTEFAAQTRSATLWANPVYASFIRDDATSGYATLNTIKPNFSPALGYNYPVSIKHVGGSRTQLDYIKAFRHMFNLMFYTNPMTREVFIMSRDSFFSSLGGGRLAGSELLITFDAAKNGEPFKLNAYDVTVRIGTGNVGLVAYSDGKHPNDFSIRKKGSKITCIVPKEKSALLDGELNVGIIVKHRPTGVIEIDERDVPVSIVPVVDWTAKVDYSKNIEITELGSDIGNKIRFAYASDSEVISRLNRNTNREYGALTVNLESKILSKQTDIVNPVFSPNINREVWPGFSIIQNATITTKQTIEEAEFNIVDTVCQLVAIDGRTGIPSFPIYPRVAFQDAAEAINLGFDTITDGQTGDTVRGLGRGYSENIAQYNFGRRITAYVKLDPKDVEAIIMPNARQRDFRGLFKIMIDGESVYCRLESVDYNPSRGGSSKCVFYKVIREEPSIEQ